MFNRKRLSTATHCAALVLLALCLWLALPARVARADGYSIDEVNIDATIRPDGSVAVVESRRFDFDGSYHGVYWEIPSGDYDGRQIETTVGSVGEMIDGQFVAFEEDYSGNDHTYQLSDYGSGVRVKLYSAHSYESAVFVIEYVDTNLAARYDDVSELYWKFVSDGWDVESQNVTCTVHLPVPEGKVVEPEENVRAWGHGPLDASVTFEGNDVVYRVPGMGTSEFAEARITFPAEWLGEATSQGGRVLQDVLAEERQWADEANARRQRARMITYGGGVFGALGTLVALVAPLFALARYRRSHKPQFDDKYFRDVPSDDHPAVLGALYRGGSPEGEDFTATLMHLCAEGIIKLELVTIESKRLLGTKRRQDYRLSLTEKGANTQLDRIDRRTVTTVFENIGRFAPSYAGTEDAGNAICFSDFEKVAKKHPQRYHDTFENWNSTVEAEVAQRRFFVSSRSTGNGLVIACLLADIVLFMGSVFLLILTEAWQIYVPLILLQVIGCVVAAVVLTRLKRISDEAIEIKAKLEALRRWLKDFTRLEEAVPRDVVLWNRLLVMAVVLGVADEVIKQLKTKMPEILEDPMLRSTYGWYYIGPHGAPYSAFNSSFSDAHHVSSAALTASSSSSGGGGGGGFSGGGGGGFGGGGGGGAF